MKQKDNSKQGVDIIDDSIIKTYKDFKDLYNEMNVRSRYELCAMFYGKKINLPKIKGIGIDNLVTEYIDGESLMHNKDSDVTQQLVDDLALFHSIFRKTEPIVLYRDAIPSNQIKDKDGKIYHLDFTSSDRFVHCFDDLALLLNPNWNKATSKEFVDVYIDKRREIDSEIEPLGNFVRPMTDYDKIIDNMSGDNTLKERIKGTSYRNIRKEDYPAFEEFRKQRAEYYLNRWRK